MRYLFIADNAELAALFAAQYALPCRGRVCEVEHSRYAASVMLADFMLGARMEARLRALTDRRLPSLGAEQKEQLTRRAMEMLQTEKFRWGLFAGRGRYAAMRAAIEECLTLHPRFDAGGFELFRLRGLKEYLAALLSVAVRELMQTQEDEEFFRRLRGFMQGRGCGYETVRLVLLANGNYLLQGRCLYGLMCLEGGRVAGYADMIIISLVCLAPRILEIEQERELAQHRLLLQNLRRIFGGRMRRVGE